MKLETNVISELAQAKELLEIVEQIELKGKALWQEFRFLDIEDVMKLTGYSKPTINALFNRTDFPCCDIGKKKIVFAPAFYDYFMKAVRSEDE